MRLYHFPQKPPGPLPPALEPRRAQHILDPLRQRLARRALDIGPREAFGEPRRDGPEDALVLGHEFEKGQPERAHGHHVHEAQTREPHPVLQQQAQRNQAAVVVAHHVRQTSIITTTTITTAAVATATHQVPVFEQRGAGVGAEDEGCVQVDFVIGIVIVTTIIIDQTTGRRGEAEAGVVVEVDVVAGGEAGGQVVPDGAAPGRAVDEDEGRCGGVAGAGPADAVFVRRGLVGEGLVEGVGVRRGRRRRRGHDWGNVYVWTGGRMNEWIGPTHIYSYDRSEK